MPSYALTTIGLLLLVASATAIAHLLQQNPRLRAKNFRGIVIPRAYGIAFLIIFCGSFSLFADLREYRLIATVIATLGILGLLDDIFATQPGGGFRRHIKVLLRDRRLTTGAMKALLGGAICLVVGVLAENGNLFVGALDGLLIALFANTLNLFDVSSGRALKVFIPIYVVFLAFLPGAALPFIGVALATLLYFYPDCRGKMMMGDVGANILGAVLGWLCLSLPIWLRAILLLVLPFLNLLSEFVSFSTLIERNKTLSWLDKLFVQS